VIGEDLEQNRLGRLRIACDKKYPKLGAWKHKHGARTVLILEDNDAMFTNTELVTNAIVEAEKECSNLPDAIYLVATGLRMWGLWPVRVDRTTYHDWPDDRPWLVNSDTLVPLTKR